MYQSIKGKGKVDNLHRCVNISGMFAVLNTENFDYDLSVGIGLKSPVSKRSGQWA